MSQHIEEKIIALQRNAQVAAEAGRFEEALQICDRLIAVPSMKGAGLRQRASVRELQQMPDLAIADLQELLKKPPLEPGDLHAIALLQLEVGQTRQAIMSLDQCIEAGVANNSTYYDNSARFFRAVANMKLGELDAASNDCSALPSGYSTHVIGEGMVSREDILKGIAARRFRRRT
jgi:tetratricopeptide (TPR) repeat protein